MNSCLYFLMNYFYELNHAISAKLLLADNMVYARAAQ